MKKITILLLALVATVQFGYSQTKKTALQSASIGFNISNYQTEFGYGINLTSPYFSDFFAIRLNANIQNLQHIPVGGINQVWSRYGAFRLGLVSRGFALNGKMSLYGEGGLLGVLPNNKFSTSGFHIGGYGPFGFEFHPTKTMGQFIEIGGGGTGSSANKVISQPIYNNGLIINAGFRIYLN